MNHKIHREDLLSVNYLVLYKIPEWSGNALSSSLAFSTKIEGTLFPFLLLHCTDFLLIEDTKFDVRRTA